VYFVLIALKKEAKYPSKIINIKNMIKKDKSIKKAKILIRNKKIKNLLTSSTEKPSTPSMGREFF
jgi:hypothetical protein